MRFLPGTTLTVAVYGASGGHAGTAAGDIVIPGGKGGFIQVSGVNVTKETTLLIEVGGQGQVYTGWNINAPGGYPNGGLSVGGIWPIGGSGGGSSAVYILDGLSQQLIVVAGGGGGAGLYYSSGGAGGGAVGGQATGLGGGSGGTEKNGGAGGAIGGRNAGHGGELMQGGQGGVGSPGLMGGGGGGGGYFGGGGGSEGEPSGCCGAGSGGGGGGSSFAQRNLTVDTSLPGTHEGNGYVVITVVRRTQQPSAQPTFKPTKIGYENLFSNILNNATLVVYCASLFFAVGLSFALWFLRKRKASEFNILNFSASEHFFSVTIAVMQLVSSILQIQSGHILGVLIIIISRSIIVAVTAWIIFSALFANLRRKIVGAALHDATVWVLVTFAAMLEPSIVRFLPWKFGEFTERSGGYPSLAVFYSCLLATMVQTCLMMALTITSYLSSTTGLASLGLSCLLFSKMLLTLIFRISAEKIHKIRVKVVDADALLFYREDGKVFDEQGKRIQEQNQMIDSMQAEIDGQRKMFEEREQDLMHREEELRRLKEERVRLAVSTAAAIDLTKPFDSSTRFANENLSVLKEQVKRKGELPLEFIPLEDLTQELHELMLLVNTGQKYDEKRLDHLLACLEINPQYQAQKLQEKERWKAKISSFAAISLETIRGFVPPFIFSATQACLELEGLRKDLAKRLLQKKCLWLVRMDPVHIERLHEAELTMAYGFEGHGLDLVELTAVYASMPRGGFPNDALGKKKQYLTRLEDSLKAMIAGSESGSLSEPRLRHTSYKGQEPLFAGRLSMHAQVAVSSEGAFGPRTSFMDLLTRPSRGTTFPVAGLELTDNAHTREGGLASAAVIKRLSLQTTIQGREETDRLPLPTTAFPSASFASLQATLRQQLGVRNQSSAR